MTRRRIKWVNKVAPGLTARAVSPLDVDEVPRFDPPLAPRDEAIQLLQVSAEIEHALMVQFLYSAYSLKSPAEVPPAFAPLLTRWRATLLEIAREEMGHLLTVQNVLRLLGGPLRFDRGDYPLQSDLYPFTFHLEPLTRTALGKYVIAEMPEKLPAELEAVVRRIHDSLSDSAGPVRRVGRLYERLEQVLAALEERDCAPGAALYSGTAQEWHGSATVLVPKVESLSDARKAIQLIAAQGEGLQLDAALPSHFERFLKMYQEWPDAEDWQPARPVPTDPLILGLEDSQPSEHGISHPVTHLWAQLFDLRYRRLLSCLAHSLLLPREDPSDVQGARAFLVEAAFWEMVQAMAPLARKLTALPRHEGQSASAAAAGPAFRMPHSTDLPDRDDDRWRVQGDLLVACKTLQERLLAQCSEPADRELLERMLQEDASARRFIQTKTGSAPPPPSMPTAKPVAVIGAGPAGLSAAMALSHRGIPVVLFERSSRVGGKVNSHRENGFSLEHGVHGWWRNYLNFDRLLRQSGVEPDDALREANGSAVVMPGGERYPLRMLKRRVPSPLHLMIQTLSAGHVPVWDVLRSFRFFIHLLAFDDCDYERYDGISFQQLMDHCRVPPRVQQLVLEPFILSFDFAKPDRVSAACGLSGSQFYVLHDDRSVLARWSKRLPADGLFGPIVAELQRRGVRLHLSTPVERLDIAAGAVRGLYLQGRARAESALLRVPVQDIPEDTFSQHATASGPVFLRRRGQAVTALSGRCTHQGCPVRWQMESRLFACPCHGGQFGEEGQVLRAPPTAPLEALAVKVQDGIAEVLGGFKDRFFAAEDVIIATDVEAAKTIVKQSPGVTESLQKRMSRLEANPVVVVRMWFEGTIPQEQRLESALTPGFQFIDNFFDVSMFAEDVSQEGHVVEVQSYRAEDLMDRPDADVVKLAQRDLAVIYPQYKDVAPKHAHVNRHPALFTHYGPGQESHRPTYDSGITGLHLAGDWTKISWSVWMMERAVVSGLRGANAALRRRDLSGVNILRLPEEGWVLRASRAFSRVLRRLFFWKLPTALPPPPVRLPKETEKVQDRDKARPDKVAV